MRLATGGVLLALVTIFLLAGVLNATAKEANTIDELVAMFDDSKCARMP